jgi:hypothetical protein
MEPLQITPRSSGQLLGQPSLQVIEMIEVFKPPDAVVLSGWAGEAFSAR